MKLTMSLLLLAIALLVGCVATVPQPASPITALLVVENQRTVDETIYLTHDGAKGRRLGRVDSQSTDTLLISESDGVPGMDFELLAIAFAAGNVDQSDKIPIEHGVVYRWQLAPMRGQNFLSARSAE